MGLNADAVDKIYRLSPGALQIVMKEFNPKGDGDDHTGKFISFAAKVEQSQRNGAPAAQTYMDPLQAFCASWNLNEDAYVKLQRLQPDVRGVVMQDFSATPGKTSKEVSALLIGFANS